MTVRSSHNFVIGDLGFHKLLDNEQHVYERATAPFRKEQFDAAPTVGDQSLAGWWTRGQLSFHKGAGVKYYEVLDGDEVLNRFQDSSGVDPWDLGEVGLAGGLGQVSLAGIKDAVSATSGGNPGVWAWVGDGIRFVADIPDPLRYPWARGAIQSISTSGSDLYLATDKVIEGPATATHTLSQYVTNPRFYAGGTAFTFPSGGASVVYNNGSGTVTVTTAGAVMQDPNTATLSTSKTYRLIVEQEGTPKSLSVRYSGTASGTVFTSSNARIDVSFTVPSAGTYRFEVAFNATGTYQLRSFMATEDPYASNPNPYDDSEYAWSGTTNASQSVRTATPGDLYPLWWPPAGRTWKGAWWAKGRLLALDDLGQWYQLAPSGGTASDPDDVFWKSGVTDGDWSVTESPAAVYLSQGGNVYKVAPGSGGDLPVLDAPAVAASLPAGESISVAYCYLGRIVLCTNLGMRVAVVRDDGSLVYGAHAVEGDFSGTVRVTALRELAYVTGTRDGDAAPSIYAVNMTADISDLQPAWARLRDVDAAGQLYGTATTPDGKIMSWDGDGFWRSTGGLISTGWLLTGYHRLGTLDPKSFQYLRVKTDGSVGSVQVAAVLPDGTETTVGTVSAGDSADLAVGSVVTEPQEYIALRFTLVGDGADGPTLLGYQLKALPLPKRQRLIRVPLMMFDVERGPTGRSIGKERDAWVRLEALESLEETDALVSFEDKDTGETGTVYIESVELTQKNGSRGRSKSNGFGGVVTVTLRKVA